MIPLQVQNILQDAWDCNGFHSHPHIHALHDLYTFHYAVCNCDVHVFVDYIQLSVWETGHHVNLYTHILFAGCHNLDCDIEDVDVHSCENEHDYDHADVNDYVHDCADDGDDIDHFLRRGTEYEEF